MARVLEILPVEGIGEVRPGDDLARLLSEAADDLRDGDVVVVTQKVVSKAEAQLVPIDPNDPDSKARIVDGESVRVLRRRGELVISETRHGFVCANAGVDLSNVEDGWAALLPEDPDRSARRLRDGLRGRIGVEVAVIISDTFGRTWRRGLTDVAIGCAGIRAVIDLRGTTDAPGSRAAGDGGVRRRRAGGRRRAGDGQGGGHLRRGRAGRRSVVARSGRGAGRGRPPRDRGPVPLSAP